MQLFLLYKFLKTSLLKTNNLIDVTLPFILKLVQEGYQNALASDANFLAELNICQDNATYKAVADDLGYEYLNASKAIN